MAHRITEDCAACGTCLPECPVGAISEGDIYVIDPNACIDCGACAAACPMQTGNVFGHDGLNILHEKHPFESKWVESQTALQL